MKGDNIKYTDRGNFQGICVSLYVQYAQGNANVKINW